jgi:hypothetical protein
MRYKYYILGVLIYIMFAGCEKNWQEHYDTIPESAKKNLWDAVKSSPNLSVFVSYIEELNYDTLFTSNDTYTLFIPDNDAMTKFLDTASMTKSILDYHISRHFLQSSDIRGMRRLPTYSGKFATFYYKGGGPLLDDIPLVYESPLYENGKYFIMNSVGAPLPNIYEYLMINNPILKAYVDGFDSIIVDQDRSLPIGFDDEGNIIYDTVAIIHNEFEEMFFPIRSEFRNRTATLVFPDGDDYNNALTNLAEYLGSYNDFSDIPLEWQNRILIPYLLKRGVFENMLEEVTFLTPTNYDTVKVKNILGDSVVIDYKLGVKTRCSNGYIYNYADFQVPDVLYKDPVNFEVESILRETGVNRFTWREGVHVISDVFFQPERIYNAAASNDSLLRVMFPQNYTGRFSVEFTVNNLFPRKYLMVVGTNMNVGGIYNIYVNDELVRTMDWGDYLQMSGLLWSVTGTKRYLPNGTYNKFDCFVDNTAEYGKTRVRFEFVEPGRVLHKGLAIDNLEFIPYEF